MNMALSYLQQVFIARTRDILTKELADIWWGPPWPLCLLSFQGGGISGGLGIKRHQTLDNGHQTLDTSRQQTPNIGLQTLGNKHQT